MKKKIFIVVLLLFGVFVFNNVSNAQTNNIKFDLVITDNCGSSGSDFTGVGWVEEIGYGNRCYTTALDPSTLLATTNYDVNFNCSVPVDVDHKIYKIHVYVQNDNNPHCKGQTESAPLTSTELYTANFVTLYVTTTD